MHIPAGRLYESKMCIARRVHRRVCTHIDVVVCAIAHTTPLRYVLRCFEMALQNGSSGVAESVLKRRGPSLSFDA